MNREVAQSYVSKDALLIWLQYCPHAFPASQRPILIAVTLIKCRWGDSVGSGRFLMTFADDKYSTATADLTSRLIKLSTGHNPL